MGIAGRLKYARDQSGLTLGQVRQRSEIGESSLSEFENGKREPSLSQLHSLAVTYHRPVSFFLSEGEIPPEVVLWREMPSQGRDDVQAAFLLHCQQYHNLEMWTGPRIPLELPIAKGPVNWDYRQADVLAKRVRDELNLGDRPAHSLLSVLEEVCGIKVFHRRFEPTGTAASTLSESYGAGILLNAGNKRWRRNYDLAHELFHLLTWRVFRTREESHPPLPSQREEQLADVFASRLLLPAEALEAAYSGRSQDGRLTYADLYDLARQFDVSAEAVLWRMYNLKLLGRDLSGDAVREVAGKLSALSVVYEERQDTEPPRWPERYRAMAVKALRAGEISIGKFAAYMEISRQKAMQYLQQEPTDGQEVSLAPA